MSNNYEPGFKNVTSVGKRETLSAIEDNIKDFLDTGLYLNHRPLRNTIHSQSSGKSFLNLFS